MVERLISYFIDDKCFARVAASRFNRAFGLVGLRSLAKSSRAVVKWASSPAAIAASPRLEPKGVFPKRSGPSKSTLWPCIKKRSVCSLRIFSGSSDGRNAKSNYSSGFTAASPRALSAWLCYVRVVPQARR